MSEIVAKYQKPRYRDSIRAILDDAREAVCCPFVDDKGVTLERHLDEAMDHREHEVGDCDARGRDSLPLYISRSSKSHLVARGCSDACHQVDLLRNASLAVPKRLWQLHCQDRGG